MLSPQSIDVGRRVMTGLLGVDALYRAESGDGEGLAVLNMDVSGAYPAEGFASYDDAAAWFTGLALEAAGLPEPDRRTYYTQLCRSTTAFIEWRTAGLPFESRLARFLHVPARPVGERELDAMRARIRGLLDGLGYHGGLAAQCAAWEERNRVPAEDVPSVLRAQLAEAWDRTEERLFEIPAPKADGMRVSAVSGVAFNARCDYRTRTIELNTDPVLTRPGLKHLAVHEGYPGHYVQFRLRETMAAAGAAAADVLLSVVNTASSSVFEGIADAGMAMLDWYESDDDRVLGLLNRYRAAIGTAAAWRLHALGWPEPAVTDWLHGHSLIGGDGWVRNRMRFIAAPARAVLIWSYWWGEPTVAAAWERLPVERRPDFLRFLHGRMHSIDSVGLFE